MLKKILFSFLLLLFVFQSGIASGYSVEAHLYPQNSSDQKQSVLIAYLKLGGDPIDSSDCESISFYYEDNQRYYLSQLDGSDHTWAKVINVDTSFEGFPVTAGGLCYEDDITEDGGPVFTSPGSLSVDITNDLSKEIEEGSDLEVTAEIEKDSNPVLNADATCLIRNPHTNEIHSISSMEPTGSGSTFSGTSEVPEQVGEFIVQVNATNGTEHGGEASLFFTKLTLRGDTSIRGGSEYCSNQNGVLCEPGAKIFMNYSEDVNNATNVSATLIDEAKNQIDKYYFNEVSEGYWEENFTISPDFNTSLYGDEIELKISAKKEDLWDNNTYNINIIPFQVSLYKPKTYFEPGESRAFNLEVLKPFSGAYVGLDQISKINGAVSNPDTGDTIVEYNKENFSSSQDLLQVIHEVPTDSETDVKREFEVEVIDDQGRGGSESTDTVVFRIKKEGIISGHLSINVSELNLTIEEKGIKEQSIQFNNTGNNPLWVRVDRISDNISEILVNGESENHIFDGDRGFRLDGESEEVKKIEYNTTNQSSSNYYSGDIKIIASYIGEEGEYEQPAIPAEVWIYPYPHKNGSLASNTAEIKENYTSEGSYENSLKIFNLGDEDFDVGLKLTGDIKDIGELEDEEINLDSSEDTSTTVSFDIYDLESGTYTGNLTINNSESTIWIPITIELDFGDLPLINGSLGCNQTELSINSVTSGYHEKSIHVFNLGNSELDIVSVLTGNLSEVASIEPSNADIGSDSNTAFTYSYNSLSNNSGYYEGYLSFTGDDEMLNVPSSTNIDIQRKGNMTVTMEGDSDIGDYLRGDEITFQISVENTGDYELENFGIDFFISGIEDNLPEDLTLDSEEEKTIELTPSTSGVSTGEFEDRTLTVTADPNAECSTSVSLQIFSDYQDDIEELQNQVSDLEVRLMNNVSGFQENKSRISSEISDLKEDIRIALDEWEAGNYGEAKKLYTDAINDRQTISDDIFRLENSEPSGGFPIVPIVLVIVFFVIGVVLFLSIVPE